MNKGDLYVTPNNQHRLVIGNTLGGDIAFATRGGNTNHDYNQCQIQPPAKFSVEGTLNQTVAPAEIARVEAIFANYIATNSIR
jgi:hypothetical protein